MSIDASKREFSRISNILENAAESNLNVLLRGERGVGKTHMILDIASKRSLRLKYFSSSTLDPFADLVGIPVPNTDRNRVSYLRGEDVNTAQFMFFDELNRSHKRVRNAVFEIIQFKSLNGEPLKDLTMVWAAVNPWDNDQYDTEELDAALLDRFHLNIDIPYDINYNFFEYKFGAPVARISYEWWNTLSTDLKSKCSPRRLEYLVNGMLRGLPYDAMVPFDTKLPLKSLKEQLDIAISTVSFEDILSNPQKFVSILKTESQKSQMFVDTCRVLLSLAPKDIVRVIDVFFEMPADYIAKGLIRSNLYEDFRKELFTARGIADLMKFDKMILEMSVK